jgi:heme a synthase
MTTTNDYVAPARWLHRWATLIVCLVWPLIWVGGLVTTYDAGMAVPDWPGTYGKNLFLYDYKVWLLGPFDLFIEHGHRLLGAVVGMLAIIAVVVAWVSEPRLWVRWLSIGLLVAVIGQGVLGGMRVVLSDRTLAMAHGCTAPLFFVICVSLAVVTSRWWWDRDEQRDSLAPIVGVPLAATTTILAYLQLLLGAQLRHVPATASPAGFTHLVYSHIAGAFLLWGLTGWLAWKLYRSDRIAKSSGGCGDLTLLRPGYLLVGFVGLQIALGIGTWIANYGWPRFAQVGPFSAGYLVKSKAFTESIVTTAHVATGSLILAVGVMVWLRLLRARFQFNER